MNGFVGDIEDLADWNNDFRRVVYTASRMQLVLMTLQPGEDIGEETHADIDQFFRVEEGEGEIWIDGEMTRIDSDSAMIVPAGALHNVVNSGDEPLKLFTVYAPPAHPDGTVHVTKADAAEE